ncbi:MAG: bifunctional diaminohydroxyphosphoribosylaminopyrimidine deaminase/5-amino-6-(5-phosphoribosylamino)uracil reductase RibD [Bacteroidia bacterium]|nr:bifunctional diaminohydroxyphosphoribosylaminopyrimidine deaminase/5-amino-6-(5-phosphoribosylamino)uracil reductase RibD [Bacteroidia bacterium]
MKIHEKYIMRCLELGRNALGAAAPNPAVGACIVHNDKIIGEGFTSPYGGPHAEVNALSNIQDKGLLVDSTLYVSLEPCSHHGKTPPCTDAIIAAGIPRVVIGIGDPNSSVDGKGITALENAGIEVITNVLEKECRTHHRRFLCFHEKNRPYIILKWAQTSDGFMAPLEELRKGKKKPYWITGTLARQRVHQWRSQEQVILAGSKTVLEDNPELSVRRWKGKSPIRVILDQEMHVNENHRVCNEIAPSWIVSPEKRTDLPAHVEHVCIPFDTHLPENLLKELHRKKINSLFIEGGSQTLQTFMDAGLWDEARVFTGNKEFGEGLRAPEAKGLITHREKIGSDTLLIYRNDR